VLHHPGGFLWVLIIGHVAQLDQRFVDFRLPIKRGEEPIHARGKRLFRWKAIAGVNFGADHVVSLEQCLGSAAGEITAFLCEVHTTVASPAVMIMNATGICEDAPAGIEVILGEDCHCARNLFINDFTQRF